MDNSSFGLLSGKYDSTKQRAVLLNGDRLRNFKSYTATMRMELMLTGQIIFTDAQFFDGLFFHWMAENSDEFSAFKELMVPFGESPAKQKSLFTVAVKNRFLDKSKPSDAPDLDKIATKMYCKPFQFSSIEDDNLVSILFDLSQDYIKQDNTKPEGEITYRRDKTLVHYIAAMQKRLNKIYGKESNYAKSWDAYGNKLKILYGIKDKVNKG